MPAAGCGGHSARRRPGPRRHARPAARRGRCALPGSALASAARRDRAPAAARPRHSGRGRAGDSAGQRAAASARRGAGPRVALALGRRALALQGALLDRQRGSAPRVLPGARSLPAPDPARGRRAGGERRAWSLRARMADRAPRIDRAARRVRPRRPAPAAVSADPGPRPAPARPVYRRSADAGCRSCRSGRIRPGWRGRSGRASAARCAACTSPMHQTTSAPSRPRADGSHSTSCWPASWRSG